jgi:UDP-GlcNAc:undecaprenyl-phosphate GlcNAc-1-phosphate transferase
MNFNTLQWFDPHIFIFMGLSFFLNGLIAYLWHKKFYQKFGLKTYQAVQRIHLNETPRLGGLIFVFSLFSFVTFSNIYESIPLLKLILICLIPIIIVGSKEDIFHNVEPAIRLLTLFFVGWLFTVKYSGPLPNTTDIPLIGKFLMLQGGISFFYILGMTVIANGMNLIDGVNGLCGTVALSVLTALLFLSYKTNDEVMFSTIFNMILTFIPFLIFNYPYGKIFLGDLGAYSLGLIISMLTIVLFGRHPEISPWGAILILIYPFTEIVFSISRRILNGVSIYRPDTSHLHLKLFNYFRSQSAYKKISNGLVTPTLSVLWLFPLITITWTYQKSDYILISIFLFVICYLILFMTVSSTLKNK